MTIQEELESTGLSDDNRWGSSKVFQNYLMPSLKLYDTRVSINHWQLRDCVKHSTSNPGKIYYIYDHSIRVLDTAVSNSGTRLRTQKVSIRNRKRRSSSPKRPSKEQLQSPSRKLVEFDFKSRCFQERNGLLISGGLMGPEDNGNWGQFFRNTSSTSSRATGQTTGNSGVEPIRIGSTSVLSDHNTYSNCETWKGLLSLYNEESGTSLTYRLGQYINNCVLLHPRTTQQYDLFACNNDAHLYQCDVSNRGIELTRRYSDLKFSLNNAALSHDGKTLITSGDSSKFAIYHQNELSGFFSLRYDSQPQWGSSFIRIKRIPRYAMPDRSGFVDNIYEVPGGDHGFYTSFSENDMLFATVFQNGTCWVYDARKMESPVAEINSTRKYTQNGAFRVCKFSEGMDDLLFVSEHHGRVHVVDTRNFMNHQVIMIPESTIAPKGDREPLLPSRRSSLPAQLNDPHTTFASNIPVKELQPQLVPYPKAMNCASNGSDVGSANEAIPEPENTGRRSRRSSSFRVRRFSTSSNTPHVSLESIDPSILESRYSAQNYRAVDNYNYVGENIRAGANNGITGTTTAVQSDDVFLENDVEVVDAYSDASDPLFHTLTSRSRPNASRASPTALQYSRGSDLSANSHDENNISGIDWMEDEDGSSLVIGTDYGIIKWKINSWARRSFPSYDFC
ncbi:LAFA_0E19878g1_1 [Lachancea sp. 'fantastica']|nr:LAFA_0E19878g1_1 [Lachancea sp. 'fantastica']